MKLLRLLARKVGAVNLAAERNLALVPMNGSGNRALAASFGFLNRTLLDSAVEVSLVLDRDYMSDASVDQLCADFASEGVDLHVWVRHELESYLISPKTISTLSGAVTEAVEAALDAALELLKHHVFSQRLANEVDNRRSAREHNATVFRKVHWRI